MTTLAEVATSRGLDFGFALTNTKVLNYPSIAAVAAAQSTILTDEFQQCMSPLQPSQGVFTYTQADALQTWAAVNGLQLVQGGHLVWKELIPAWATAITNPVTLRAVMETHIQTVISRFGQTVTQWNVVNEVISNFSSPTPSPNPGDFRPGHWYDYIGSDYVKYAFDAAQAVCPTGVKLVFNQAWMEFADAGVAFTGTYNLVQSLLQQGVRIDGVGFQCHLRADFFCSGSELAARFQAFADLGLEVYVTELDVDDSQFTGTPESIKQQCADFMYQQMMPTIRDVSALKHITCWSPTDEISWLNDSLGPRGDGIPRTGNLYDRQDPPQPNPMRQALIDAMLLRAPVFDTSGNVANTLTNDRATITVATPGTAIEVRFGTDVLVDHNGLALTSPGVLADETSATLNDQSSLALLDNEVNSLAGQTTTGSESVTLTLTGGT
jgi:endo-1,4-beta-xylanase